jgi:hypothetical protein
MTAEEKQKKYRAGKYAFPPPPVSHARWREEDWIRYIDAWGKWL